MWPTVWLSPVWRCVLHQPVASQVYLFQLTLARLTDLTLLIKVLATVTVYRKHRQTLFSCMDYLPVHYA